jgi:hypothetical protein
VVLGCVLVGLLVAWYAGTQSPPPAPQPSAGSVRLGPDAGEPVPAYLARLRAELPPPGFATLALVQLAAEQTPADALATTTDAAPLVAVLHVPMPRVQTALRFEQLEQPVAPATALDSARQRARAAAEADAGRLDGRARAVAAAEAAALADPTRPCVLALVVRSDRAGLESLAARQGVRAVHAAPPGTTVRELAISPLLPGQVDRADPLPDDGSPG